MTDGIFFALEGIDGSGTTTQRELLGEHVLRRGHEVLLTNEPSEGPIGLLIRTVLAKQVEMVEPALALTFAADRLDHLQREIEPAVARGAVVLSDRYVMSSLAYQALDLPIEWVQEINALARVPDATFFLRVKPDTAAGRRRARGGPEERFDDQEIQKRIAQSYEAALEQPAVGYVHILDAEADIETVAAELRRLIDEYIDVP